MAVLYTTIMFCLVLLNITWMCWKKIQEPVHCATGSTFADFLALQKTIVMCSVLASSIGTLLEDTLFRRETNLFEQTFRRVLLHGDTDDINPKVFQSMVE